MMARLLAPSLLLLGSTAALADGDFSRTLSVSAKPDLYVSTGSGSIHIHPGGEGRIEVRGHVHAGWGSFGDVNARIQRIIAEPPITQSGNDVHIGEVNDRTLFNNISIDYDITVPAAVALNLHSGSGDLDVDHVARFLAGTTGSGSVRARGIEGPAELQTGSGSIELEEAASGDVKARTGSGSIQIRGLNGGLTARTGSGSINADGRLSGPANLATGSGSVHLRLSRDSHFDLGASTGSGDIQIDFPGAPPRNSENRHHVTAPVNGGGPALEVRTGSGDITIASI